MQLTKGGKLRRVPPRLSDIRSFPRLPELSHLGVRGALDHLVRLVPEERQQMALHRAEPGDAPVVHEGISLVLGTGLLAG